MTFLRYFAALWIAILFYAFSSFFVGGVGISAYDQLNSEREKQLANLEKLQDIHSELLGQKEALENDLDTIAVHARELGYGTGDERFIKIVGRQDLLKQHIEPGDMYIPAEPQSVPNRTLLIISIIIFVCMLLSIVVVDILRYIKNT
ncbi:MAG: septum formation initiator family protein [Spirochaetaceae bacterium]|jgi:cell division protein FtsB|nr:septum formation initiator family protein [Spirochaetaceae bacterium]